MIDLRCGVKIYDNDWFLRHNFEPEQAADWLAQMGVTYVITQSRYLPMSDSAVKSVVDAGERSQYAALDDLAFRHALKARGIAYFACLNICFDPAFSQLHDDMLPIDQFGRTATQQDWYLGIPPDRCENLYHKTQLLRQAVEILVPDGVHLGFVRWPGFWETWLPGTKAAQMPDYCYGNGTLERFMKETGVAVPLSRPVEAAQLIRERFAASWRDWKCAITGRAIATIRAAILEWQPETLIAINTLPFFADDFDNAVTCIFGQDIAKLAEVVDIFEVMAYHQIMKRDVFWPAAITNDIKRRSQSKAICTIQAKALYLDGIHAGQGRESMIRAVDFARMLESLATSMADGVCVFTFSDLLNLRQTSEGQDMLAALRHFRAHRSRPDIVPAKR